jgi:hypothetical protein
MDAAGSAIVHATSPTPGARAGDEVVQLYVRDVLATVARPVLQLRGFTRIHLRRAKCARSDSRSDRSTCGCWTRRCAGWWSPGRSACWWARRPRTFASEGSSWCDDRSRTSTGGGSSGSRPARPPHSRGGRGPPRRCTRSRRTGQRRMAGTVRVRRPPSCLAARRARDVHALRREHLHRPRVGGRHRRVAAHLRARCARRAAVGARRAHGRLPRDGPHGQASRRLLPVAHRHHQHSVAASPFRGGAGDRGARVRGGVPRAEGLRAGLYCRRGIATRRVYGDSPRYNDMYARSSPSCSRATAHSRSVVRRRQRRRAERQAAGVRLAARVGAREAAAAGGGDLLRCRPRRALDRQRNRRGRRTNWSTVDRARAGAGMSGTK